MVGIQGLIYFNYAAASFGLVVLLNQLSRLIPHLRIFLATGYWGLVILTGITIIITRRLEILIPFIAACFIMALGVLLAWLP